MLGLNGPSIHCTDISQLSAGETNLYAIAASIIKEWDIFHGNDNIELSEITGCVLIDEADVNLHIDFAYRTFIWDSEASIKAHVHCVIVGFRKKNMAKI